jgi:TonB family protein
MLGRGSSRARIISAFSLLPTCVFAISFFFTPRLCAQEALLNSRAAIAVDSLKEIGAKRVVVCDFSGPKGLTALGINLADEFSATISRDANGTIDVVDRAKLPEVLHQLGLEREYAGSALQGEIAAQQLSADSFVSAKLFVDGDELTIHFEIHRVGEEIPTDKIEASFTLDAQQRNLLNTQFHDISQSPYPFAGSDGYSTPKCIYCPNAQFTDTAVKKKAEGTVVILALIDAQGRVANLRPLVDLPYGLTAASMKAVQNWQFKPAVDANGMPTEVRQTIDLAFRTW